MPVTLGDYASKFTTQLDTIIERESLTSDLGDGGLLGEFTDAGEVKIPDIVVEGLADYSRTDGFVSGGYTFGWQTYKLRYDRGREFNIDILDDEERAKIVSANVMSEFTRTKVIPEMDAVRFATMHEHAGVQKAETITTPEEAVRAIDAAENKMQDIGIDLADVLLYCTSEFKSLLRAAQNYRMSQGENPNGRFTIYDDMKIIPVPSARFQTKIELLDGTTSNEEAGGFKAASDAKLINFMLVDPSAALAIQKHQTLRYFSPAVNQKRDAHLWQYRVFHDLLVRKNKKDKIFASVPAA